MTRILADHIANCRQILWPDELCDCLGGPITERRQRAMEALRDAASAIRALPAEVDPIEVAIETATTVKMSHEIVMAFVNHPDGDPDNIAGPLVAAFRAAGFEVEQ